jgi:hypothetical protein
LLGHLGLVRTGSWGLVTGLRHGDGRVVVSSSPLEIGDIKERGLPIIRATQTAGDAGSGWEGMWRRYWSLNKRSRK